MKTEIKILKAYQGDCLLIQTFDIHGDAFNILIDGGPPNTFKFSIREALKGVATIDLLVLTHIDSDHIGGLINFIDNSLFDEIQIKKFWVNCANLLIVGADGDNITYNQALTLEKLLIDKKVPIRKFNERISTDSTIDLCNGICFEILSPPKEILDKIDKNWPNLPDEYRQKVKDQNISASSPSQLSKGTLPDLSALPFKHKKTIDNDLFNSSSIAIMIKGFDFSILCLADSRAEIIESILKKRGYNDTDNRLKVDFLKVSHHGSKNNTSNEVLDMIDCSNFIFSTNGGVGTSKHPDRETIARILYHPNRDFNKLVHLYFNYPMAEIILNSGQIFTDDELRIANANYSDDIYKLP